MRKNGKGTAGNEQGRTAGSDGIPGGTGKDIMPGGTGEAGTAGSPGETMIPGEAMIPCDTGEAVIPGETGIANSPGEGMIPGGTGRNGISVMNSEELTIAILQDSLNRIRQMAPRAVQAMAQILESKSASWNAKIQVINIILNRAYGMPESSVKITSEKQTIEASIAYIHTLVEDLTPKE